MHLARLRRSIPQLQTELANQVVAVEAAKFHNENFRAQAWTETGRPWPPRKDKTDKGRAILVKTGRLRRSATTVRTRGNVVDFIMPIYGKTHNEGGRAGRGAGFQMPRRQFVGPSRKLQERIKRKAEMIINRRLNRL
jgi:phage gpG-like protein